MDRLKTKRTTRRAQNTKLIQEASALLERDDATLQQIDSIYERLKSNNEELKKINDEMESHISDEAFEAEYATVIEYEDNATRILAELQSKRRQHSETSAVSAPIEVRDGPAAIGPADRPGAKLPKLTINPFADKLRRKLREDVKVTGELSRSGNTKMTTMEKFECMFQGSTKPSSSKTVDSLFMNMTTRPGKANRTGLDEITLKEKETLQRYETRLGNHVQTCKSQSLEPAFHANQKRVTQAKDAALREAQAVRNVSEQATSMETKMAELRLNLREEQAAREREHRAHENKLKELQRLLIDERTHRENFEYKLKEAMRKPAQAELVKEYESKVEKLTQELDEVRKKLLGSEKKMRLIFPLLLKMHQLGMEQCDIELEKEKRQPGHVVEHQQTMRRETEMGSQENRLKELSKAGRTHDWLRMQDCAAIQQIQERPSLLTREDATSASAARIGPKNTELPSQQIKPEREDIAGPFWQQAPAAETVEAACAESPMDLLAYIRELAGADILSLHAKAREKLWQLKEESEK
ncbi:GRIP and coiled-coil domain-containing protein 1-like [Rhipicephalus sanguineus]|uniref:GRIP and coiled-coil domain-containing protein 1-like n=1 Tax=Rhipicephalus sanguineus TaxID=34632 RepID=UPI001892FACC|nr:GRIP and coiled-coil domain-containing protein 1-like [Rhipicephalus sanguineus]